MKAKGLTVDEKLIFDYAPNDCEGVRFSELEVPPVDLADALPQVALRKDDLSWCPQLSEFEVLRHFTRLSKLNVAIDNAMYPLGSCTMKYNPRINETVSRFDNFLWAHPLLDERYVQGTLEILYRTEQLLSEITGFPVLSLQPAAGAQGELTGVLLIKSRLEDKGEHRPYMLVPDTAHGTNPSSASIAGFKAISVRSRDDGTADIDDIRAKMTTEVAGLMLTNPNTFGVFEPRIKEIADAVHSKGGYIYCDGANMNAQMGKAKPHHYGMDVMHLNLHKTFSTPHGGGGPGSGPCLCSKELEPYLPVPRVVKNEQGYAFDWDQPKSIGKLVAFYGNVGVALRALSYIIAVGGDGLQTVSEVAVLNANYLREKLKTVLDVAAAAPSLHEVVFNGKSLTKLGINTMSLAKRMMDYGFHPPTVYFPLTVTDAIMIEPTETENKPELDRFIEVVKTIIEEAKQDPALVNEAPHTAPRRRFDEAAAARNPVLRWRG